MAYTIIPRHGTLSAFSTLNRVYSEGELLLEEQLDGTYKAKVGDGATAYNSLSYLGGDAGGGNAFGTIAVSGQSSVTADNSSDTLTIASGNGITTTTNATTDTISILPTFGTTANTICQGNDSRLSNDRTPTSHATSHMAGGGDNIKLDALAPPDDVTTLNATTSAHGLLRKLSGLASQYLRGDGEWSVPIVQSMFSIVTDFGAIGDGVANDTAAVNAAIANNRIVYFPAGTYLLDPITMSGLDSITFLGAGKGNASRIKLRTNGTLFTLSACTNIAFRHLLLCDESSFVNGLGIDFVSASSGRIYECTLYGFRTNAVRFMGTLTTPLSSCIVRDCWFLSNGQDTASAQLYLKYSNDFSITGNQIGSFFPVPAWPGVGLKIEESRNGTLIDNMIWLNTMACQIIGGDYNRVVANRFEESRITGLSIVSTLYMIFTNNWINDNSTSSINTYDACQFYNVSESLITNNIVYAWANPTRLHRRSYSFEEGCVGNTIANNKSLHAGTSHLVISSGSAGNTFDADISSYSLSAVSAGATVFLGSSGAGATAGAANVIPCRSVFVRIFCAVDVAPGGSQTVQFTFMLDGSETALTATISGSSFGSSAVGSIYAAAESFVCVKVVYSASAATSVPRCVAQGMKL